MTEDIGLLNLSILYYLYLFDLEVVTEKFIQHFEEILQ